LDEVNEESTAYLVEIEDAPGLARWLTRNGQALFENELNAWYTDPSKWPADRSVRKLRQWCDLELHTIVLDMGRTALDDGLDN
jgi:hypothetical protein